MAKLGLNSLAFTFGDHAAAFGFNLRAGDLGGIASCGDTVALGTGPGPLPAWGSPDLPRQAVRKDLGAEAAAVASAGAGLLEVSFDFVEGGCAERAAVRLDDGLATSAGMVLAGATFFADFACAGLGEMAASSFEAVGATFVTSTGFRFA